MAKKVTSAELRTQLQGKLNEAKGVMAGAENGILSPEQAEKYDAIMTEVEGIKSNLDRVNRQEGLDAFLNEPGEPRGGGAAGWTGEAIKGEGNIDGVVANGTDIFGITRMGEHKTAVLSSGEYKDAINHYIRVGGNPYKVRPEHAKVLQEGQDTSGGFFVPVDQRSEVVKKMATITGVRNDVKVYPTGSDLISFPKVVYTTDDQYTAGTRISWTAEAPAADISESTNPVAGQISIPVHTATAAIILTRAMIEDSAFDIMGYISDLLGETYALGENNVILNGTGVGQLQGIYNHANAGTTYGAAGGGMLVLSGASAALAWGTGGTTGIMTAEAALPPQYDANAKWYGAKATFAAIRALNATTAGIQWSLGDSYPNAANGYSPSLLGHPIVKDQFVEAIAAAGRPLVFGDLSGYFMVERVGLGIQVFDQIRGLRDEVVVYARRRIGGQLVHDWKVKLLKSNNS